MNELTYWYLGVIVLWCIIVALAILYTNSREWARECYSNWTSIASILSTERTVTTIDVSDPTTWPEEGTAICVYGRCRNWQHSIQDNRFSAGVFNVYEESQPYITTVVPLDSHGDTPVSIMQLEDGDLWAVSTQALLNHVS